MFLQSLNNCTTEAHMSSLCFADDNSRAHWHLVVCTSTNSGHNASHQQDAVNSTNSFMLFHKLQNNIYLKYVLFKKRLFQILFSSK